MRRPAARGDPSRVKTIRDSEAERLNETEGKTMVTELETKKAHLQSVRAEIATMEAQYAQAGRGLGSLLARFRSGDKKAGTEAGKVSMDWATLDTQLKKLQLEEASLTDEVAQLEEAQRTRDVLTAIPAFEAINDEARELEAQFAELIQSAAEVGRRLREIRPEWHRLISAARAAGGSYDALSPRVPTLLSSNIIDDPETRISQWRGPDGWEEANLRLLHEQKHGTPPPKFKVFPRPAGEHLLARFSIDRETLAILTDDIPHGRAS